MIVWLASYPRSGNTLLRTILKQTMNLGSYSDELPPSNIGFSETAQDGFGHVPLPGSWMAFYAMARASKNVYLVKTHLPPHDNQPVIYIVRDGRRSLVSYQQYHRKFFPEYSGGLIDLVLGADYYGSWSEHFEKWNSGQRRILLLRYEELVNASPDLLQVIAQFVGYDGPVLEWANPFSELQKQTPDFFRVGAAKWEGAPGWSELVNGAFFLLHGDLMNRLGYESQAGVEKACASLSPELIEFVKVAHSIQQQKALLDAKVKIYGAKSLAPLSLYKRFISWVQ